MMDIGNRESTLEIVAMLPTGFLLGLIDQALDNKDQTSFEYYTSLLKEAKEKTIQVGG